MFSPDYLGAWVMTLCHFIIARDDSDSDILAAVLTTSADLRFLDVDMWAENLVELSNHELPVVRRNLVPSLREYFETFPDDTRKLLPVMWQDGDEVVRTRMRELLIKMSDISSTQLVLASQI